jgi:hypothetical protein
MKRLLALVLTATGAVFLQKKLRTQQAESRLWAEATDTSKG